MFKTIQMDFLEGMGSNPDEGKKRKSNTSEAVGILVIVCAFTRYVKLYPVMDKTADTVRRCLHMLYCTMGIPNTIISDGAPAFASLELEKFLKAYDVEQDITHPHWPQSHGIVERVNQETSSI